MDRITVSHEEALTIARIEYARACEREDPYSPRLATEDVWVKNRSDEIIKYGAYPGEIQMLNSFRRG